MSYCQGCADIQQDLTETRAQRDALADALHEACLAAERINEGAYTSISREVIQNWLDTLARSAP